MVPHTPEATVLQRGAEAVQDSPRGGRKRAEPGPKRHVPIIRGCSPAALRPTFSWWEGAGILQLFLARVPPLAGEAEPMPLRSLALSSQGAAKWFVQPDTPGTKAALRLETLGAQQAGWPAPITVALIWPAAGRSLSLGSGAALLWAPRCQAGVQGAAWQSHMLADVALRNDSRAG